MFEFESQHDRRADPALKHYLRAIGRYELLSRAEETELARRAREGDADAFDRLVNANLRFVVSVAKRFLGRGLGLMDLIAEGNVGLITAARHFDERRDFRFVTYAVWWIRQNIQAALQDQTRTVRLPANRARQAVRIVQARRNLEQDRHRAVGDEELAAAIGAGEGDVARIRAASRPNVLLDSAPGGEGLPLQETLADQDVESAHEISERRDLEDDLDRALAELDGRERLIIEHYYGLGDVANRSLEDIGAQLNLSRERVRQLRNRAFRRLRDGACGMRLAEHLG
jgi:RNA polymerase primary sigma factor